MNRVMDPRAACAALERPWVPHVLAELNGQLVKVARFEGAYVWHRHADEDELFLLLEGDLSIELRGEAVVLEPGQLFVVPRGVEHRPVSRGGASVLLFEPAATRNTGDVDHELTIEPGDLPRL